MLLDRMDNVTFTSNGVGTLDGNGERWWGIPGIGFLVRKEDRPNLFKSEDSTNLLVENLFLKDSPHWTFEAKHVDGLEIRNVEIEARRTDQVSNFLLGVARLLISLSPKDNHNVVDLTAFNTDGFDVSGRNVWIHDCTVWNQVSNQGFTYLLVLSPKHGTLKTKNISFPNRMTA